MSKITVSQYENKAEYLRQWRAKNPDKCKQYYDKRDKEEIREKAWERRYGIKREWYDTVLKIQGGCCAICKSTEVGRKGHTYFHVDHDHDTGEVRGLLCDLCNRGLGYFKDNSKLLLEASNYLEKHDK
jgi:hypothetical protein